MTRRTTCLVPMWDVFRYRCSQGAAGVCAIHGPHQPHPDNGQCDPRGDGYCRMHGVYADPYADEARS